VSGRSRVIGERVINSTPRRPSIPDPGVKRTKSRRAIYEEAHRRKLVGSELLMFVQPKASSGGFPSSFVAGRPCLLKSAPKVLRVWFAKAYT
jgi:hypothetical protein